MYESKNDKYQQLAHILHLIDNWRPQFLLSSSKFDDHQRLFSPPVRISRWFFSWASRWQCHLRFKNSTHNNPAKM